MTVTTENVYVEYNGNGATQAFAATMQFFAAADLVVTLIDADDVETVKTISTHYSVSGGETSSGIPATGTVTMITAPASGSRLRIERASDLTQATTHEDNDAFPAKTVEAAYDARVLVDQETQLQAARAVKQTLADYIANGAIALPSPVPASVIAWNAAGDALVSSLVSDLDIALVSAFVADLLALDDEAAFRAALSVYSDDEVDALLAAANALITAASAAAALAQYTADDARSIALTARTLASETRRNNTAMQFAVSEARALAQSARALAREAQRARQHDNAQPIFNAQVFN